ncbi:hypothetical protein HY383_00300 [Candidatus Daviesbacteria bacterium]|nr:hypothetical protein [Candidatus Daviesbacteria bacterium]
MIFKLTAKNCEISAASYKHISRHFEKMTQLLPHVREDLVVLRVVIRKNIDKYHPSRIHPHQHRSYADYKPALAYYEGSITFRLDKKRLYAHFKGQTIDECFDLGFDRIFEELEKYKDLHFPSESEYPNHSTIRGGNTRG